METYSVKDIADLHENNPETVRRWIRSGKLKATRGASKKEGSSISSDDLLKFLENNAKYAGIVAGAALPPSEPYPSRFLARQAESLPLNMKTTGQSKTRRQLNIKSALT